MDEQDEKTFNEALKVYADELSHFLVGDEELPDLDLDNASMNDLLSRNSPVSRKCTPEDGDCDIPDSYRAAQLGKRARHSSPQHAPDSAATVTIAEGWSAHDSPESVTFTDRASAESGTIPLHRPPPLHSALYTDKSAAEALPPASLYTDKSGRNVAKKDRQQLQDAQSFIHWLPPRIVDAEVLRLQREEGRTVMITPHKLMTNALKGKISFPKPMYRVVLVNSHEGYSHPAGSGPCLSVDDLIHDSASQPEDVEAGLNQSVGIGGVDAAPLSCVSRRQDAQRAVHRVTIDQSVVGNYNGLPARVLTGTQSTNDKDALILELRSKAGYLEAAMAIQLANVRAALDTCRAQVDSLEATLSLQLATMRE